MYLFVTPEAARFLEKQGLLSIMGVQNSKGDEIYFRSMGSAGFVKILRNPIREKPFILLKNLEEAILEVKAFLKKGYKIHPQTLSLQDVMVVLATKKEHQVSITKGVWDLWENVGFYQDKNGVSLITTKSYTDFMSFCCRYFLPVQMIDSFNKEKDKT